MRPQKWPQTYIHTDRQTDRHTFDRSRYTYERFRKFNNAFTFIVGVYLVPCAQVQTHIYPDIAPSPHPRDVHETRRSKAFDWRRKGRVARDETVAAHESVVAPLYIMYTIVI
jgi:hypothetical protein